MTRPLQWAPLRHCGLQVCSYRSQSAEDMCGTIFVDCGIKLVSEPHPFFARDDVAADESGARLRAVDLAGPLHFVPLSLGLTMGTSVT